VLQKFKRFPVADENLIILNRAIQPTASESVRLTTGAEVTADATEVATEAATEAATEVATEVALAGKTFHSISFFKSSFSQA
jgi:hypothetical protein